MWWILKVNIYILYYHNWKYNWKIRNKKNFKAKTLNPLLHLLSLNVFYLLRSHLGNVLHKYCVKLQNLAASLSACSQG